MHTALEAKASAGAIPANAEGVGKVQVTADDRRGKTATFGFGNGKHAK